MSMTRKLLRINHFYTESLSYSWCACIRVPHCQFIQTLHRESCAFSSRNLFGQKSVFTLNCKFLQTFIHTEKTREPLINIHTVFHKCSVFFYRQQGVYHISVLLTFLITIRAHKTYWCSRCIACQGKKKRLET